RGEFDVAREYLDTWRNVAREDVESRYLSFLVELHRSRALAARREEDLDAAAEQILIYAEAAWKRALLHERHGGLDIDSRLEAATSYEECGRLRTALLVLDPYARLSLKRKRELHAERAQVSDASLLLARTYLALGLDDSARNELGVLVDPEADLPELWGPVVERAVLLRAGLQDGDEAEARDLEFLVSRLDPRSPIRQRALYQLGVIKELASESAQGRRRSSLRARAERHYLNVIETSASHVGPESFAVRLLSMKRLAEFYERNSQFFLAAQRYAALASVSLHRIATTLPVPDARNLLRSVRNAEFLEAEMFWLAGKVSEAESRFHEALSGDAESLLIPWAHLRVGQSLALRGSRAEAYAMFQLGLERLERDVRFGWDSSPENESRKRHWRAVKQQFGVEIELLGALR
ncbi:MAG: hypothetical protein AAF517_27035, partial [Planctomycetota bacterium]